MLQLLKSLRAEGYDVNLFEKVPKQSLVYFSTLFPRVKIKIQTNELSYFQENTVVYWEDWDNKPKSFWFYILQTLDAEAVVVQNGKLIVIHSGEKGDTI